MWFNPSDLLKTKQEAVANLANSANRGTLAKMDSQDSQNSQPTKNIKTDLTIAGFAGFAKFATGNTSELKYSDDRRYCHECLNISRGYCSKLRLKIIDTAPRRCAEFVADHRATQHVKVNDSDTDADTITCGECGHFQPIYKHGSGSGRCAVNVPSLCASGFWADTSRVCRSFEAKNFDLYLNNV